MAYDDVVGEENKKTIIIYVKDVEWENSLPKLISMNLAVSVKEIDTSFILGDGSIIDKRVVYKILPNTFLNSHDDIVRFFQERKSLTKNTE